MDSFLIFAVIMGVAMAQMTKDQMMMQVKKDFLTVDIDKNHMLSEKEFHHYYNIIDANHDHHLKQAEFIKNTGDSKQQTAFLYKYYDVNGDGDITPSDVKQVFHKYDSNGDKEVSYAEFMAAEETKQKILDALS